MPIKDVFLSNKAALRGILLRAGTPEQRFSGLPMLDLNNTYLYDAGATCGADTTQNYSAINTGAAGAALWENITSSAPSWGQDTLNFDSGRSLQNYPLGLLDSMINTDPSVIQGNWASLGLGRNSTILSKLKSAGTIGSRAFGLWWGLAGATQAAQMDGSLVLGGYDEAKVKSDKNHTGSIAAATICPSGMTVTINSIVLNFPNGSNPNLLDPVFGSSFLQACICLQCSMVMSMPLDPHYERFETWSSTQSTDRSLGINFFNMMYPANNVYQGDLTITLDSGFSVRIPNSQLVLPDQKISDAGNIVSNTSVRDVNLYSLQDVNKNDLPRLGYFFFTSTYLMVDHDAATFTIWEANPTTDTKFIAITANDTADACPAPTAATGPAATTSRPTTTPSAQVQEAGEQASLSKGAIGGIVAGGIVASAAMGLSLIWLLRRWNNSQSQAEISTMEPQLKDGVNIVSLHPAELSNGPPSRLEEIES